MVSGINPFGSLEEKKRIQRTSNLFVLGAFALFGSGIGLAALLGPGPLSDLAGAAALLAFVSWVLGCVFYAKSKGYTPVLGCIGLLSLPGLLILLLIPDRWKAALALEAQFGTYAPYAPGTVAYPR